MNLCIKLMTNEMRTKFVGNFYNRDTTFLKHFFKLLTFFNDNVCFIFLKIYCKIIKIDNKNITAK